MLCSSDLIMWISPLDEILKHESVHSFTGPVATRMGNYPLLPFLHEIPKPTSGQRGACFSKTVQIPTL